MKKLFTLFLGLVLCAGLFSQAQIPDTYPVGWLSRSNRASATSFTTTPLINFERYVDIGRTDTYTADGTAFKPYKSILAALTAVNADVGHSWILHVASGTYADNLTITGPRYLKIEGAGGVVISGTILINSGVGAYDRIEFVGTEGGRSEKGPAMTLSGAITCTRTNDSLIYVGFHGCYITGALATTTDGTWVLQYENCRINGAITGTFSAYTGSDPHSSSILIEAYGFNEFVGTVSGITSFYNCNGADIYSTINITPHFENRFTHTGFNSAVTIVPKVTANSTLVYADRYSYKSLLARTPTLTGASYSFTDKIPISKTLTVAASGGDYISIQSAITYAATQTPSATNLWTVEIMPGTYTEAVAMSSYVNLKGMGTRGSVVIYQANANVITLADHVEVQNLTVRTGATGADLKCFLDNGVACTAKISDVNLESTETTGTGWYGFYLSGAGNYTLDRIYCYNTATAGGTGDQGIVMIDQIAAIVKITNCDIYMSGAPGSTSSKSILGIIGTAAAVIRSSGNRYDGDAFCNMIYGEGGTIYTNNDTNLTLYADQIDPACTVYRDPSTGGDLLADGTVQLTANWLGNAYQISRLVPVLALTDGATQTISAAQCQNYVIHNGSCTQAIEMDLPAAAIGMQITVYVVAAFTVTLDPNLTDQIMVYTSTAGDYLRSDAVAGTVISLVCLQANKWFVAGMSGSWTEE